MDSTEKIEFSKGMMILAEIYNRKLSELLLQTYWDCLKTHPLSLFQKVLGNFLKNPDYAKKGFPSPADWIKAIEGDSESKSLAAWTEVIKAIRSVGQYESVRFSDPIIHTVINDMGGWILLCKQPERELIFLQKKFERHYKDYSVGDRRMVTLDYLTGQIEHQNRVHGFEQYIPLPIKVSVNQIEIQKHSMRQGEDCESNAKSKSRR